MVGFTRDATARGRVFSTIRAVGADGHRDFRLPSFKNVITESPVRPARRSQCYLPLVTRLRYLDCLRRSTGGETLLDSNVSFSTSELIPAWIADWCGKVTENSRTLKFRNHGFEAE